MSTETDIVQESPANEIVRDALEVYGSYVLEDRALADIRDGLKPVQRRILWALWSMRRTSRAIPIKCATVVGEVTGKYHPHGDDAAYGALVTMSWLGQPLVERHGNFGNRSSLVETSYANKRYTETRLTEFSDRQFDDIDIMPIQKSFTEEHDEPVVIPSRVPLLFVNGSLGVAVGLSSNIPPHSLSEVIPATKHLLRNPNCSTEDLLKFIKGPDYGKGVLLSKRDELKKLYTAGRGKLRFSCQYQIESGSKKGTQRLVITSFAPEFRNKRFLDETVKLQEQKLLTMAAYDDGSLETGTRVVVEFTDPKIVRDRLLPLLETSVSYQMYCLSPVQLDGEVKKVPRIFGLKEMLQDWISFRRIVETKVLRKKLTETKRKIGVEQARLRAIAAIDDVVSILKSARSTKSATKKLMKSLDIQDWQAETILGMSVSSLMRANEADVRKRGKALVVQFKAFKKELSDIDTVIERRLDEMKKYSSVRGTRLRRGKIDDLDTDESSILVAVTPDGKIDRFSSPPIKSKAAWKYVDLVLVDESVTVITDENVGQQVNLSYLDKFQETGRVVGIASDKHEAVLIVTKKGRYVAFDPNQKRTRYPVVRKLDAGDALSFAVGLGDKDIAWVRYEDGSIVRLSCNGSYKRLSVTNPNVTPKSISRRRQPVTNVWVQRAGEVLYDKKKELGSVEKVGKRAVIYRVGVNNLVVREDGRRVLLSAEELIRDLEQGTKHEVVVPIEEN